MIIAIDGPAGSGKSSTARRVAEVLGFWYLDTGAMYRTVALHFMRFENAPSEANVEEVLVSLDMAMSYEHGQLRVQLGGEDVTAAIRTHDVSAMASKVAKLKSVRERLVQEQRLLAKAASAQGGGVVVEGRDIGTVVFPHAERKFFFVADPVVRAQRRMLELQAKGASPVLESLVEDMKARDKADREREHSPLLQADDAIVLDTTHLSLEDQVNTIVDSVRQLVKE